MKPQIYYVRNMTPFALCGSLGSARHKLLYIRSVKADHHRLACSVYQEIWKSGKLYEYPVANLDNVKSAAGPLSDGWGLTTDQTSLIMSDGSSTLSWVDPQSLAVQRTISVSMQTHPVPLLEQAIFIRDAAQQAAMLWDSQSLIRFSRPSSKLMPLYQPQLTGPEYPLYCRTLSQYASKDL